MMDPTTDQLKYASAESGYIYSGAPIHSRVFSNELPHPPSSTVYDSSAPIHDKHAFNQSALINRHAYHQAANQVSATKDSSIKYVNRRDSSPVYLPSRSHQAPPGFMHRGLSSILIDTNGNPTSNNTNRGGHHHQRLTSVPRSSLTQNQWCQTSPSNQQQQRHRISRSPSPPQNQQSNTENNRQHSALLQLQQPLNNNVFSVSGPSLSIDPSSIVTSVQLAMHQVLPESSLNQSIDGRISDIAKEIITKTAEVSVEKVLTAVEIRLAPFLRLLHVIKVTSYYY